MGDDGGIVFNEFVPDVCRQVSGDLAHRCSDPGPVSQDKTNVTLQKKHVPARNVSELIKTASRGPVRRMQAKTSHKRWEHLRGIVSRAPLGGAISSAATTVIVAATHCMYFEGPPFGADKRRRPSDVSWFARTGKHDSCNVSVQSLLRKPRADPETWTPSYSRTPGTFEDPKETRRDNKPQHNGRENVNKGFFADS